MNAFLLDTNVPSELIRPRPDPRVKAWISAQDLETLYVSAVSFGEWRKGLTILEAGRRKDALAAWLDEDIRRLFSGRVLPMTKAIAERWGVLEGQRHLAGRPFDVTDAQIAATAMEHGLTLATRNVKDFEGIGLAIVNPWAA